MRVVKVAGEACGTHGNVCPCCYEAISVRNSEKTTCGHCFHWICLAQWADTQQANVKTCPVCRAGLADKFQWPKTITTRTFVWLMDSRAYAQDVIKFIDGQSIGLAKVMYAAQIIVASILPKENYKELLSKLSIPNCRIDFDRKVMWYDFEMNKTEIAMPVKFEYLEDFDMVLEMRLLKYEIQILLQD